MQVSGHSSKFRLAWDLLAVGLVILSGLVVTYQLAFAHGVGFDGSIFVYVIDLFFLIDIFLNFRTTFRDRGQEVTDRKRIGRRYVRSVFILDLLGTVPFDAVFLLWSRAGLARVAR